MMAARLTGQISNLNARAFIITPFITVGKRGSCLTFSYFVRSLLEIKLTSESETIVIASYNVDGGRAWHRARLTLITGRYRILWETRDASARVKNLLTPYQLYHAAVDDIDIRRNYCARTGKIISVNSCKTHARMYKMNRFPSSRLHPTKYMADLV